MHFCNACWGQVQSASTSLPSITYRRRDEGGGTKCESAFASGHRCCRCKLRQAVRACTVKLYGPKRGRPCSRKLAALPVSFSLHDVLPQPSTQHSAICMYNLVFDAGSPAGKCCCGAHCCSASSHTCNSFRQECSYAMLHRIWQGTHSVFVLPTTLDIAIYILSPYAVPPVCLDPYTLQLLQTRSSANLLILSCVSTQTLAYLLPVLTKAIQNAEEEFLRLQQQGRAHEAGTLQALVVVPSRELAMQIVRVAQGLLPHEARATIQQCIGGANPNRQVKCNLHMIYSCA